jgi:hypothetical protein
MLGADVPSAAAPARHARARHLHPRPGSRRPIGWRDAGDVRAHAPASIGASTMMVAPARYIHRSKACVVRILRLRWAAPLEGQPACELSSRGADEANRRDAAVVGVNWLLLPAGAPSAARVVGHRTRHGGGVRPLRNPLAPRFDAGRRPTDTHQEVLWRRWPPRWQMSNSGPPRRGLTLDHDRARHSSTTNAPAARWNAGDDRVAVAR